LAGEEDRKVLREAIKHAQANTIRHRIVPPKVIERYRQRIDELMPKVKEIIKEEKEDRLVSSICT
jgi:ATP-dependent RNA helicase DDX27